MSLYSSALPRQSRLIQVWLSCIFVEVFSRTWVDIHICSHTFLMYKDLAKIHIGRLIDACIKELGLSYAEFARRLNVERTTVYNIVRTKSIDVERLIKISDILDYDFLRIEYLDESPTARTHVNLPPAVLNEFLETGQVVLSLRLDDGETRSQE